MLILRVVVYAYYFLCNLIVEARLCSSCAAVPAAIALCVWRVAVVGARERPAVLQLCNHNACLVVHLSEMPDVVGAGAKAYKPPCRLPSRLQELFFSRRAQFVGVAVRDDIEKVRRTFQVRTRAWKCLECEA